MNRLSTRRLALPPLVRGALVVVIGVGVSTCRLGEILNSPAAAILQVIPSLPDSIVDSAAYGSTAQRPNAVTIKNLGGGELTWQAQKTLNSPWISFKPDSGKAGDPMMVVFRPDSLQSNVYTDTVVITTPAGIAKTPVHFTVHPCRPDPILYEGAPSDTLNSADCGAPHRTGNLHAEIYSFSGTSQDSASIYLSPKFNGFVALDTAPFNPGATALATTTNCQGNGSIQCIAYFTLPRTTTYYIEVSGATTTDSGAFKLLLTHGRKPNAVDSLDQRLPDSTTSIPPDGTVGASVLLRAVLSDSDLVDSLRLQAEVQPVSQPFTGFPNTSTSPTVGNGKPAWVSVTGLSDNTLYHWQVRAIDQTNRLGKWDSFPSSPAFNVQTGHDPMLSSLNQYLSDGTTPIPNGGTAGQTVVFKGLVSTVDPGKKLHLELEYEPVGTPLDSVADVSSTPVATGATAAATATALTDNTNYYWWARVVDDSGRHSAWMPFNNTTPNFHVQVGIASLLFTTQPAVDTAGHLIHPNVVVTALDQNNQIVTSYTGPVTMSLANNAGGGTLSGTLTVNAVAGVATFTNLSIDKSGTGYTLRATTGIINSAPSSAFNVLPGPATQLAFTVQPTNTQSGSTITPAVVVTAQDALGNAATSYTTPISVAILNNPVNPPGTLLGTLTQTPVNGSATFANLSIAKAGNGYTLGATSGSLPASPASNPFNITAGVVTHLAFTVPPSNAAANATIAPPVQVAGEDANNNINTTFTGTVSLAIGTNPPGNGVLSGAPPTAAVSGVATFSNLSIDKVGTGYTLIATSGLLSATSPGFTIANTQISPTLSMVVPTPNTITASNGASQSTITVTARDLGNNLVVGASVSLSVTGTGNTVLPAGSQNTNAGGQATWTLSSTVAEVKTITAIINSVQITNQPTVTVNAGTITNLFFNVQPSQTTAGLAISPAVQVTARDAFTNTVTSFTGNVTMTVASGPGGSLTGTTLAAATAGIATFSNLRIRTPVGLYMLQASIASPLVTGTSNSFSIVAGSATRDTFIVQPTNTAVQAIIDSAVGGATVWITDSIGNLVTSSTSNVTVALFDNTAGGTLNGTKTRQASGGIATFNDLRITKISTLAGLSPYSLIANASGLAADVSARFDIIPGPAKSLVFKTQPTNTVAGSVISPPVQVAALDVVGDTATGFTGNVTLALNPSATLGGTNPVAAIAGIATFSNLTVPAAGTYTLTASTPALPSGPVNNGTSSSFNVATGGVSASQSTISASPNPIIACKTGCTTGTSTASTITVTAKDGLGNPISGAVVTVSSTSTSANITQPALATNGSGQTTGTITDTTTGSQNVSANITLSPNPPVSPSIPASLTVNPAAAAAVFFIRNPLSTTAGATINNPGTGIQVQINDQFGNKVGNATNNVGLEILVPPSPAGGVLAGAPNPKPAVTGVATFSNLSIAQAATGYVLRANSAGLASDTSTAFNITTGTATKLAFVQQPTSTTGGATITPAVTVEVEDASGNRVTTATNSITLAIGLNPNSGTLSGTKTVAASSGLATFSNLSIDSAGTGYTLTAAATSLTGATSSGFNIAVGAPAKLAYGQPPTSTTGGATISPAVTVRILDAGGNLTTSTANVSVAITSGTGDPAAHLSGTTAVAAVSGVATFSTLSIDSAATGYKLDAASAGLTGVTSPAFNITAGAASKLAFGQPPTSTTGGATISPAVTVRILDAGGNLTSSTANVTLAITSGTGDPAAHLSGTTTVAAVAGVATFSTLSIDSAFNGYKLDATSGVLTGATSSAFNITVGPAARLIFGQQPTTTTGGGTISPAVTVKILDAGGNQTNSTASVTVAIGTNPNSGSLSGTKTVGAVAGVASFNTLSIDSAGTGYTLHATSGSLTATNSSAFTINVGSATKLAFHVQPSTTTAGSSITPAVQVEIQDPGGNRVTTAGNSIVLAITGGTGTSGAHLSGTTTLPASSGLATFSGLSIDSAGSNYELDATSGVLTGATSTQFNINAGALSQLVFTVQPSNAAANTNISPAIVVTAQDAIGNTVTSFTGNVVMTIGVDGAVLPPATLGGTATQPAVAGQATFSDLRIDQPGTNYQLKAAVGAVTVLSAMFNIL